MAQLDYSSVNRYWNSAKPSMLGPYMMDGFGFPDGAGWYRFKAEQRLVDRLTARQNPGGRVLDLGCGIGHWAEHFAARFTEVVAVEGSSTFFDSLKKRAAAKRNLEAVHANVMDYTPTGSFEVIFLGGLLMYLNEADVIALLQRLAPLLNRGGIILCRESTVREGSETRQGEYQATYRSKQVYSELFNGCDLTVDRSEMNVPYVLLQMGCEIMKVWKAGIPAALRTLTPAGHLVYAALRLANPWITRVPTAVGWDFPHLKNHFFLLKRKSIPGLRQHPIKQPPLSFLSQ
jgi:SAM-dependent methyltransferase